MGSARTNATRARSSPDNLAGSRAPKPAKLGSPTDDDVHAQMQTIITRLMKLLARRSMLVEDMEQTYLAEPGADGEQARMLRPLSTIGKQPAAGRRRRRIHSDEFKADAVAAASQPGVSMASVALARGVNANQLLRWVREAEIPSSMAVASPVPAAPTFVHVALPEPVAPAGEIRNDVRHGATTMTVAWPMAAAGECARWLRAGLR